MIRNVLTGILAALLFGQVHYAYAGGNEDFNDCRASTGAFCERAGSCEMVQVTGGTSICLIPYIKHGSGSGVRSTLVQVIVWMSGAISGLLFLAEEILYSLSW